MNETEVKRVIIDTLTEQNAFKDLPPSMVAQMAIDMVFAILKKASEK